MSKTLNLRAFQLCGAASTLVLMSGFSLALAQDQTNSALIFKPAYVVSATDIPYPIQSIAIGTVVLEVVVSETGKVDSVLPIREIDSLTEVAIDSVKNWQFRAASLGRKSIRSRTTVAVTFNPAAILAADVPLPPLSPRAQSRDDTLQPQPVDVLAASFPQYPPNSVAYGTVVLRAMIDEAGKVEKTVVVRRIPSLNSPAIRALKEWKFKAAEFESRPVHASIALAFVFRLPLPAPGARGQS